MSNLIDTIRISGVTYALPSGTTTVELTQAEYDALVSGGTVDPQAYYIINDSLPQDMSQYTPLSAITSSITSASTYTEVASAKAVYDMLGGIKLQAITQSDYTTLVNGGTTDPSTLYFVGDSNGYTMKLGTINVS